jgi:hypothetical protein
MFREIAIDARRIARAIKRELPASTARAAHEALAEL